MSYSPSSDSRCCYRYFGCICDRGCLTGSFACAFLTAGIVLMIALLAVSIKTVDHDEYAISYHTVFRRVGSEVLQEGRHTVLPGVEFFTFNRKFNLFEEPIDCLSQNGLEVGIIPSAQYQWIKEGLLEAFGNFGQEGSLKRYAEDLLETAVRNACANFTAEQFFTHRAAVERDLIDEVNHRFEQSALNQARVGSVQLKNVMLPLQLQQAISRVQQSRERINVTLNVRRQALIEAETVLLNNRQNVSILLVDAQAEASAIRFDGQQQAGTRAILWSQLTTAMEIDLESFGMTPDEYVRIFLLPKATLGALDERTRACLQGCTEPEKCWFCWTSASPAVPIPS